MKKIFKIALAGCGHRGHHMLKLANNFDDVKVVGLCENNHNEGHLMSEVQTDFPDVECFKDFREMLDKTQPDIFLIETPATIHAELAIAALERNIHVMSDIPCVRSIEEADALWQAQQNSSAMYMTGANPNMWAFVRHLQTLVKKGLLGKPSYIECEYIHDCRSWWEKTPWRAKSVPIRYCTHSLGPMLSIIDDDLRYVSCFDTGSHINEVSGQHDWMSALFRTEDNVTMRFLMSAINEYPGGHHHYRVMGTKGSWERTADYNNGEKCYFYSKELHEEKKLYPTSSEMLRPEHAENPNASGHGGADYALWEIFLEALRKGETSAPIDLKEGLRMTLPGIYAAKSAKLGGQLLTIEYPWDK
jgi:predicted dehydrogenase